MRGLFDRIDQQWLHLLLHLGGGLLVDDREGDAVIRGEVISDSKEESCYCSTPEQEEVFVTDTPTFLILTTIREETAVLRPSNSREAKGHDG